jgi:hypothetical protein
MACVTTEAAAVEGLQASAQAQGQPLELIVQYRSNGPDTGARRSVRFRWHRRAFLRSIVSAPVGVSSLSGRKRIWTGLQRSSGPIPMFRMWSRLIRFGRSSCPMTRAMHSNRTRLSNVWILRQTSKRAIQTLSFLSQIRRPTCKGECGCEARDASYNDALPRHTLRARPRGIQAPPGGI